MKNVLFFILCLSLYSCGKSQDFRGYIEYEVSVQSKDSTKLNDQIIKSFGTKSTFYYQDGSYFQDHVNSMMDFGYLDSKSKTQCLKFKGNDTLYMYDATKNVVEKFIKRELSSITKNVLNYDCKRYDIYAQNLKYGFDYMERMYFTDKIKIDGDKFKGLKLEFMDEVYGTINSIPLYFEIHYPNFILKYTAIKIENNDKLSISELINSKTKGLIKKTIK